MDDNQKKITAQIEKWIAAGRNPGVAYWHGALEAAMASFQSHLQPGRLATVHSLAKGDYPLFEELYAGLDLCPDVQAAYMPTAMGGVLTPPPVVDSLRRVHKDNPSAVLVCRRPGPQPRILCAEISPDAWKPGADLFEEGGLLGNYEYDSGSDCIRDLPKLIRAHLWRKEKWAAEHYADYTFNWFERVVETGRAEAPVQPDFSYVHSPVLLNLNAVDATFKLIQAMATRQLQDEMKSNRYTEKGADQENRHRFLEGRILALLSLLRDSQAVDFTAFTPRENELFKDRFAETVQALDAQLQGI